MADVAVQNVSGTPHSSVLDRGHLVARLDELLEQYLCTLDAYQKARQQLTKHLSSGYMSLAQANFTNDRHARYGQDYYDERMQASRKVALRDEEDGPGFLIRLPALKPAADARESSPTGKTPDDDKDAEDDAQQEEEPAAATDEKINASQPEQGMVPVDPIRWFGVLVPPALRSAQTAFVSAVEGPVPELCSLLKDLRQQEIEIGRVRKQIKKM